jgi:hypothetical protein
MIVFLFRTLVTLKTGIPAESSVLRRFRSDIIGEGIGTFFMDASRSFFFDRVGRPTNAACPHKTLLDILLR